jgi:hypothetical protein
VKPKRAQTKLALSGGGRSALMWAAYRTCRLKLLIDGDVNAEGGLGHRCRSGLSRIDRGAAPERGAKVNQTSHQDGYTALHGLLRPKTKGRATSCCSITAPIESRRGENVDAFVGTRKHR